MFSAAFVWRDKLVSAVSMKSISNWDPVLKEPQITLVT